MSDPRQAPPQAESSEPAGKIAAVPVARDSLIPRLFRVAPPQVMLALLLTAAVSIVILAVSELTAGRISQSREEVASVRRALTQTGRLRASLAAAESSQRGFLLTTDEQYLKPFDPAIVKAQAAMGELVGITGAEPAWIERITSLQKLVERKLDELKLTVYLSRRGELPRALNTMREGTGVALMEDIASDLQQLDAVLGEAIARRQVTLDDAWLQQRFGVAVVVLINLIFLSVLANMLIRSFTLRETHRAELQRQADRLEKTVAERTAELSSLSSYLQSSGEREKARLARDLHDELGGILTSAKIDIAWLEGHCKTIDPDAVPRLQRLSSVLDEAVDLKRRVVENLRPSLLDHLGIGAALTWHVTETCKKAGLKCNLQSLEDDAVVSSEMAIAMYRLVQEGLTNIVKYAKASEVDIALKRTAHGYAVHVADNGVGISGLRAENLSHGLAGMRQRAYALGGTFHVSSTPGRGTRIEAFFPVNEGNAASAKEVAEAAL